MTERPILFSGAMVRAILAGTKTQTRRLVTDATSQGNWKASELLLDAPGVFVDPGPSPAGNPGPYLHAPVNAREIERRRGWKRGDCDETCVERLYPRLFVGDRLWVREAWLPDPPINGWPGDIQWNGCGRPIDGVPDRYRKPKHCLYAATWTGIELIWRPSIHMPRWASRLALEVTAVRCERIQGISEADAAAEGVTITVRENGALAPFRTLWDSINGKRAPWASNPWVWVVSFQVVNAKGGPIADLPVSVANVGPVGGGRAAPDSGGGAGRALGAAPNSVPGAISPDREGVRPAAPAGARR